MTSAPDHASELHALLHSRPSPQQVAGALVRLGVTLPAKHQRTLARLGQHASYYSSMSSSWRTHPGLARPYESAAFQVGRVTEALGRDALAGADPTDPKALARWVAEANELLGLSSAPNPTRKGRRAQPTTREAYWGGGTYTLPATPKGRRGDTHGHADPRTRLDAASRKTALPGVSVRLYRHAVRSLNHLEARLQVLRDQRDLEASVSFAKARLAHTVTAEELSDRPTAAFVTYYASRLGMRSAFTNGSQERPMDDLAQALLDAALASPGVRPEVIARVLTRPSVLALLSDSDKGDLMARYYEVLSAAARTLARTFDPNRDRTSMTVRQGDDSSTWNAASRAFNQARTGWLNLLVGLDLGALLAESLPGKVPALIASDVSYWHASSGGGAHADTAVFADLALPWEVVLGTASCTEGDVRAACKRAGLDPDATGWTSAYRQGALEAAAPAPELVHGVAVGSPALAAVLKKSKAFSGQA
jgi:hypothetical protein